VRRGSGGLKHQGGGFWHLEAEAKAHECIASGFGPAVHSIRRREDRTGVRGGAREGSPRHSAILDISDAVDGMLTKDRMARIRSTRLAEVSALTNSLKQSRDMALRAHFDSSPVAWERVGYELEKVLDKHG
jgi:hypothetical protein